MHKKKKKLFFFQIAVILQYDHPLHIQSLALNLVILAISSHFTFPGVLVNITTQSQVCKVCELHPNLLMRNRGLLFCSPSLSLSPMTRDKGLPFLWVIATQPHPGTHKL